MKKLNFSNKVHFLKEHHKLFHKHHDHLHHKHHHHHHNPLDSRRSLLRSQTSLGIYRDPSSRSSRSRERTNVISSRRSSCSTSSSRSASRERARSKTRKIASILKSPMSSYDFKSTDDEDEIKKHHHHHHHHKRHQRKNSGSRKNSLSELHGNNWKKYVEPKVKCWNCNCKHDKNVY